MQDKNNPDRIDAEDTTPIVRQNSRNCTPFMLLLVLFFSICWYPISSLIDYAVQQMEYLNIRVNHDVISGVSGCISFCAGLFVGILADNFLGRYQSLLGTIAAMAVAYLGVAVGGIPIPNIGNHGLGVASGFSLVALLGSLRTSLIPFIGDQTTGDRQRLIVFACFEPVYRLSFLPTRALRVHGGIQKCKSTDLCHVLPNVFGFLACASIFCLIAWKKQFVRQKTFQGNVMKAVFKMFYYSAVMRMKTAGDGKSLTTYAQELDQKLAEDLVRVGKTFFIGGVNIGYYLFHDAYRRYFYKLSAFVLSDPVHDRIFAISNTHLIVPTLIVACIVLGPKLFSIIRAMVLCVTMIGLTTTALLCLDAWRRSVVLEVPRNHTQFGVINDLNTTIVFRSDNKKVEISPSIPEAFTIKASKLVIQTELQSSVSMINFTKELQMKNFSHAAVIHFLYHHGKPTHRTFKVRLPELPEFSKIITTSSNLNASFAERKTVWMQNGDEKEISHYVWYIDPEKKNINLSFSENRTLSLLTSVGATYAAVIHGEVLTVLKLFPGYQVRGTPLLFIAMMCNQVAESVTWLLSLEYVYSQAPSHMRSLLQGIIFTTLFVTWFIAKLVHQITFYVTSKETELAYLLITTIIALEAMGYGAWKLSKEGVKKAEPVETEKD